MSTATGSPFPEFPHDLLPPADPRLSLTTPPLFPASLPEADPFARHRGVPGHRQDALHSARITLVGAGGLNSWAALAFARGGVTDLTIVDHDWADFTNLPRQLFFAGDVGRPKAHRLAQNLLAHAVAGARVTGIALPVQHADERYGLEADVLVVGVDNNACRLHCARRARQRRIPAVFTMLSTDGMRCQCFLQGPDPGDPCLWCALPNLDPDKAAPCNAGAILSGCFLASAFTVFFAHRALMGWPEGVEQFNWREADLLGVAPDQTGKVLSRADCGVCGSP